MKRKREKKQTYLEYRHKFHDHQGNLCNVTIVTSDHKRIKTDRVFLASESKVFAELLAVEGKEVHELTLDYSYDIVSSALAITSLVTHKTAEDALHVLFALRLPRSKDLNWLIQFCIFGLLYQLIPVITTSLLWIGHESRIDSYSVDEVTKIYQLSLALPNIGLNWFKENAQKFMPSITKTLPVTQQAIIQHAIQPLEEKVKSKECNEYLFHLSQTKEAGQGLSLQKILAGVSDPVWIKHMTTILLRLDKHEYEPKNLDQHIMYNLLKMKDDRQTEEAVRALLIAIRAK